MPVSASCTALPVHPGPERPGHGYPLVELPIWCPEAMRVVPILAVAGAYAQARAQPGPRLSIMSATRASVAAFTLSTSRINVFSVMSWRKKMS